MLHAKLEHYQIFTAKSSYSLNFKLFITFLSHIFVTMVRIKKKIKRLKYLVNTSLDTGSYVLKYSMNSSYLSTI